ncbi:MAG: ABC transporter permease [Oscillospiraceae bacterium]|jgi:taurine ABC transporter, permease protein|nr:ABC transporter permease [Oscillospiraceae bacterium]CCX90014.1 aBC-type transporter integral membrane subunit [Firmicutes bacterium CAG:110]
MEKQKNQYANGRKVRKLKDFSDGPASARHIKHILSLVCGVLIWWLLSLMPGVGVILAGPQDIIRKALPELLNDGSSGEFERFLLVKHIRWSFQRVLLGWAIAFAAAIPTAFLMGWYRTFRDIVDPWIQFLRTIPPIALIPMVILLMGTGEKAKITVIFITAFLVMTVTIYQGIRNLDYTLVKAAYTFGANDFSIFVRVVVPYTFPYILTAARLGVSTALTTLIAAEMTGTFYGLGSMIQTAQIYFRMDKVMLGIICIGIIGFILDRLLLLAEKKLTRWQ